VEACASFCSYVNPPIDPLVLHQKSSSSPLGGSIRRSGAFAGFLLATRVEFGADLTPREKNRGFAVET